MSKDEFHLIDKEFRERENIMNNDIKNAIGTLRLPIIFQRKDLLSQYKILKSDFKDRSEGLDKAFVKLENYLKEA